MAYPGCTLRPLKRILAAAALNHDRAKFEERKKEIERLVARMNTEYGEGTVTLELRDQYYNMREKIEPVMHIIDIAFAAMEAVGVKPNVKPIAATLLEVTFCRKANAFGPFTQNSPMWDTSNTPTKLQTVRCSSMMPEYSIEKLTDVDLSSIPYYTFKVGKFAGEDNVIISNTGYTGAGGFELYFYPSAADTIWTAIFEAGEEFGIKPVGLGARDTLRLEMGFCLYGNDLDDTTSPIEAGLGWITKFVEGKNFINRLKGGFTTTAFSLRPRISMQISVPILLYSCCLCHRNIIILSSNTMN